MKRYLPLFFLALTFFSCRRDLDVVPDTLEGTWRMTALQDKQTGLVTDKPPSIMGEVEITFVAVNTARGFFNGLTPTNKITAKYFLSDNQGIEIPEVSFNSKVAETPWGMAFVLNITEAKTYSYRSGNKLVFNTGSQLLYFKKI